jgi:hypothetical protein
MSKLETNTIDTVSGSTELQLGSTNATIIKANDKILFNNSGDGIYLGVTSATASNLLDDYEEGTWTPTITSGGGTLTNRTFGYYTKIGRMVHLLFQLELSASGTGAARIGGLPFTASDIFTASVYHGVSACAVTADTVGVTLREDSTTLTFLNDFDTNSQHTFSTATDPYRCNLIYYTDA